MKSFNDVLDKFGRSKDVAKILGITISHVEVMRVRQSISPYHWEALVKAAEKQGIKGITFKRLAALYRMRFEKPGEAA